MEALLIEKTMVSVSEIVGGTIDEDWLTNAELAHEIACYGELFEDPLFTEHLRFDVECLDRHGPWSTLITQGEIALQANCGYKLRYDEKGWTAVCREIAETLGVSPAKIVSITAILDPDHWSLNPS